MGCEAHDHRDKKSVVLPTGVTLTEASMMAALGCTVVSMLLVVGSSDVALARRVAPCEGDCTKLTLVEGTVEGELRKDAGVVHFLGVPFAAPPLGDLRWEPPQPHAVWDGTRPAKRYSDACMQSSSDLCVALCMQAPITVCKQGPTRSSVT